MPYAQMTEDLVGLYTHVNDPVTRSRTLFPQVTRFPQPKQNRDVGCKSFGILQSTDTLLENPAFSLTGPSLRRAFAF